MKCPGCGFKNGGTVTFCQKCGGKMDLTVEEIQEAMVEKARGERRRNTDFQARQTLFFGVALFLIGLTLYVFSTGAESGVYEVPAISSGARYLSVDYSVKDSVQIPKVLVPLVVKKP